MKCNTCGLPFSPDRTYASCPRCGSPVTSAFSNAQTIAAPQGYQGWGQNDGFNQAGNMQMPQNNGWGAPTPEPLAAPFQNQQGGWNQGYTDNQGYPGNQGYGDNQGYPGNQVQQGWNQQQAPQPQSAWEQASFSPPPPNTGNRTMKGLLIAVILVILGGVILVAVFIGINSTRGSSASTANSSTSANSSNTNQPVTGSTAADPNGNSTPTATASASTTPAGAFPGKTFIDNSQTATKVDPSTGKVLEPANTFAVKQNIYIDFNIHAQGKDGTVCIVWYLNNQHVTDYALPVKAKGTTQVAYAYSVYTAPGNAYVELSWANDSSCANKLLAQHTNFTVTP